MIEEKYEIERKFLIRYPNADFLSKAASKTDIVQTYLCSGIKGRSERVRKRGAEGQWCYTHTVKTRVNELRRIENEREISEEEYLKLLENADPKRNIIYKTRYCLDYGGLTYEIDIYPFWSDRAILEVELEDEEQKICLPPAFELIREVTHDKSYTNSALAKKIPGDLETLT